MEPTPSSPDGEVFSTPPTTPAPKNNDGPKIGPSLSRRSSRPSSIHTEYSKADWTPDVVLDVPSPDQTQKIINGNNVGSAPLTHCGKYVTTETHTPSNSHDSQLVAPRSHHHQPDDSPCFLHSHLNKNTSLAEAFRPEDGNIDVSSSLHHPQITHRTYSTDALFDVSASGSASGIGSQNDEEEEFEGSLTKKLADTAVGVREMSKQLGRACVRSNIQSVLIITKAKDNRLIKLTRELALYLMLKPRNGHSRGLVVYVDHQLRHSKRFDAEGIESDHPELFVPWHGRRSSSSSLSSLSSSSAYGEPRMMEEGQLRYWTSDMCSYSPHLFDFVVTLGGDGTVLFTSWLFQRIVPPVLPFALGSLGFLTNFDFADHQTVMDSAIDTGIRVNLRMRFTCTIFRSVAVEAGKGRKAVKNSETGEIMMKNVEKGGWEALEGGWSGHITHEICKGKDKEIMCFTTRPVETFEVLNDLVVDRGPSPYVSLLELFGDEHHMTTVQADGLTVSTPTGSTAYSLSAGGSLVHPEIPALLITPICPHTLSFRPMLLPDSMELRICVPFNSRSTAWASFDGRGRVELKQGDHIKVTASKYPFPTVCADKQSTDWFHAISRTLKWNERERQKSFVVVEEGPKKARKRSRRRSATAASAKPPVKSLGTELVEETLHDEENEVSDEYDEDGKFDIDDSSPEASREKAIQVRPEMTSPVQKDKSRPRTRSVLRSGGDTRSRFAGPHFHPPRTAIRHPDYGTHLSPRDSDSSLDSPPPLMHTAQHGARDDIHTSRAVLLSGKSRLPKDRADLEFDFKTPTTSELRHNRRASRNNPSAGLMEHQPRAFAVWGQDESDSNNSESESDLQG